MTTLFGLLLSGRPLQADRSFLSEYDQTGFSEESAIPVTSANKVLQTRDGYIWVASYNGLVRFDGQRSKVFGEGAGLPTDNIFTVFEDSAGRLWVGTNDSGVALYEDNRFTLLTVDDGLPSQSVREIAEDSAAGVYVSTTSGLAYVSPSLEISLVTTPDGRPIIATSVDVAPGDYAWCVLNEGGIVAVRHGEAVSELPVGHFDGANPHSVYCDEGGLVYFGSYDGRIFVLDPATGEYSTLSIGGRNTVNGFGRDSAGRIWTCSDNGIGYIEDGAFTAVDGALINNSMENMIEDYEGNYWFASSRSGVLLLSRVKMRNVFFSLDMPDRTVNAIAEYHGILWLGTDDGLLAIGGGGTPVENDLTRLLGNVRVRSLAIDADDNLWIGTYQNFGAVRYRDGVWLSINSGHGLVNDRVRAIWPRAGGGVIVATTNGISIIGRDGAVERNYSSADGLATSVILNVLETPDGVILAGSDGGGIYRIEGDSVTSVTARDGLASGIILRMTLDEANRGVWVSTGNGVSFIDQSGVRPIEKLAGRDNSIFDIRIAGGDALWLLGSGGVLIASRSNLLSDAPLEVELIGKQDGLTSPVTANSWNHMSADGVLYVSCTRGVHSIDTGNVYRNEVKPRLVINSVAIDERVVESPDLSEPIVLPPGARRIIVEFALLSYIESGNNKVSVFLEGFDGAPAVFDMGQASSVSYTNLVGGKYALRLAGVNYFGVPSDEIVLRLQKEFKLLEMPSIWLSIIVAAAALVYATARLYGRHKTLQKDKLLIGVNQAATLLTADIRDDPYLAVWRALKILGESVLARSAFLWRNGRPAGPGAPAAPSRIAAWLGEAFPPAGAGPAPLAVAVDTLVEDWAPEAAQNGNSLRLDAGTLAGSGFPSSLFGGSKYFTVIRITMPDGPWGFIGFASQTPGRSFSDDQIDILASGGLLMASALERDDMITDLLEAKEEALAGAKAKSDFLARMSHEIRTPMNAVIGMSELALREDVSPPAAASYVSGIHQAGRNLMSIINDILDFSRIELGQIQIEDSPYEVGPVLGDAINVIRTRAAEKRLLFIVEAAPDIPGSLLGDALRLRQILLNLLSNAVKYTREGFVRLSASAAQDPDGAVVVSLAISDSGVGIRPGDIDRLFGDFVRVDTERNAGIEGTGLGLSISRRLCRAMGGDITVSSVYGQGSEFVATIRQTPHRPGPIASVDAPEGLKVLVWHGSRPYAESILRTLESLGVAAGLADGPAGLASDLAGGGWTHALVAAPALDDALMEVESNGLATKVALLADDEAAAALPGLGSLLSPAWAVPVANLLNGAGPSHKEKAFDVGFTAPGARVLVVDDISANLQVARGLLHPYRVETDTCSSGEEALRLVVERSYDLVLMDHMMPGMDGQEATRRIRGLGGLPAKLPVVAMTANALAGMREKFLEGGFDDYLAKPVELSSLNAVLERWIPEGKRLAPARIAESGDAAAAPVEIAGLDTARGLAAAGGTWDNYLKVLRMFQLDAADRLPFLKSVAGAPGGPADASSARRLITEAHALKSALANIGALDLSRDAAALEELGRNGDLEAAGTALGPFCEALSSLSGRIAEALAVRGAAGRGAGAADGGAAPDLDVWRRLREALISTDPEAIDAISSELQSSPNPLDRDSIARVSDHVLVADFGKAVEEIDAFLATL